MKKMGLVAGISFLAGVLFFALFFGYIQRPSADSPMVASNGEVGAALLQPPVANADSVNVRSKGLNFAPLVKKVRPAVVKVMSESIRERGGDMLDRFFNIRPRRERVPGVGSGFFISADGYIITNNHVVKDAIKVKIKTIDNQEYTARIVGTDSRTDLALLKVDVEKMPFISLGDSNKVEVGEWVLAIGNPLNQDLTVTAGIISAKGRQLGMAQYEDFLQTDAAINRGNSGGPLINMEGKVIGINSAILAPSGGNIGIGFAIPSSMAAKVIRDLKSKGRVVRGYMGVSIDYLNKEEAAEFDLPEAGVMLIKVERDSPAEIAGLKKYDMISEVNGEKVKSNLDLSMKIAESSPGDIIELTIYRKREKKIIKVKVGESPDTLRYTTQGEDSRSIDLGMVLVENSPGLARELNLAVSRGLVVKETSPNSAARENRIRKGDVILEANGNELETVEDFRRIVARKKPGSTILLYVNRGGDEGMVRFRLPE
jgi:serine protease Do